MTSTDTTQPPGAPSPPVTERIPVLDSDVHQNLGIGDQQLRKHLPARWQEDLKTWGIRHFATEKGIPPQREFTHRLDSIDPSGRPTFLPDFTRQQLLDEYDMSAVILSNGAGINLPRGGGNFPEQLGFELGGAFNDAQKEVWLKADPRFYASIHVPIEHPREAAREIERVKTGDMGDRYPS